MVHRSFVRRQLLSTRKQGGIFMLCVALAVFTHVALGSLRARVQTALLHDARQLHAADIIVHSHAAFAPPTVAAVTALQQQDRIERAQVYEFYSMVRTPDTNESLLAHLKVVESGYPFYGRVELASQRDLHDVLKPGGMIVDRYLLERLNLRVGARLRVGKTTLTIQDVVLREPDRPVQFFALGPRIFVALEDLPALDLVQKGSRVTYHYLLKVEDENDLNSLAAELAQVAAEHERVTTFQTAESGVKVFVDNFLSFLNLTVVFTLLLAGLGIHSTLTALTRDSEPTIAIMKTVGATSRFITMHFLLIVCLLGGAGTLVGLGLGVLGEHALSRLFRDLLPPHAAPMLPWPTILESGILGSLLVALFAFLPLYRLKDCKPDVIFRKESPPAARAILTYLTAIVIGLFFVSMILWRMPAVDTGMAFVFGSLILLVLVALITQGVLWVLKKPRIRTLCLRQALKGLGRPGNATRPIMITLTVALAVLFSVYLIEQNLKATFIAAYPQDAPNLFFLDIQPSQLDDVQRLLAVEAEFYPVVSARIRAINGQPIDRERERQRRGDNLAREFRLTYRPYLLADEALLSGESLFQNEWDGPQVSVLDTVVEMQPMTIGDRIRFTVHGIPLEARIASIRTRTKNTMQPFFYFVFPEHVLRHAPHTIFTAIRVAPDRVSQLQNTMVAQFPNVSVIDVTQTITAFSQVMHKLSTIIRFFTSLSLIAGVCILISSLVATRAARIREAVYFTILGATRGFVRSVFALESLFMGLISALLALLLAHTGSWMISTHILNMQYRPFIGVSLLLLLGTMLLVILVGQLASRTILQHKPALFLREQTED